MKPFWVLLFIMFLFTSCEVYKDINVEAFENLKVSKMEGREIDLELILRVENPNFYAVKLKDIAVSLFVNNKTIGNLKLNKNCKIKRKATDIYSFRVHIALEEGVLLNLIQYALQRKVDIQIKGKIKGSVLGITQTEDVDFIKAIDGKFFNLKSFLNLGK